MIEKNRICMLHKLYNILYWILCNHYNEVCIETLKCLWYVKWKIPDTKRNVHHDYKYVKYVHKENVYFNLVGRDPV